MRRRAPVHLLALVLVLLLGGCQVTLSAGIDVHDDGSGTVTAGVGFDDEALAQVGDLAGALRADDLRQAGWEVSAPAKEDDGLTWVRASKEFDDVEEAAVVAAELSGPDGPFRDFHVTRERSLLRTRTSFTGVVDLGGGLAGLSDAELQTALGDFDLDLDVEGLRRRFGDALDDRVRVQVSATLPGDVSAAGATVDGSTATWTPAVGERVDLVADAKLTRLAPLVYGGVALAVVGLALAAVALRARQRRRQARRVR